MLSNKSIWIVEDDKTLLKLIGIQISSFGVQVRQFLDSEEMLNTLNDSKPDIIVSDYMMPKFTGLDIIRNVRSKNLEIPILIISGFIDDEEFELLKDYTQVKILNKPFSKDLLKSSLKSFLK